MFPFNNAQKKNDKKTNNDLQNIYIKLKIDYQEPHEKSWVKSGAPEG
jgi:hypothetical protein